MKIKLMAIINDPIGFKKHGASEWNISLLGINNTMGESHGWIPLHEIEINTYIAEAALNASANAALDKKEQELLANLELLRQQRKELFSIAYQPEPEPIKPTPTPAEMFGDDDIPY